MGGTTGTPGTTGGTELVLVGTHDGVVVLTSDTPLRRLNYFDGKFLRAEDMQAEQAYLRLLVQLSNQAGGSGVVHGYDTTLAQGGAAVTVGQGLAVDPQGRILLMPVSRTMPLDDLIAATANGQKGLPATPPGSGEFADCVVVTPPTTTTSGESGDLYLLTVGFLEALCGEEDVFGQICDDACVQSKDRRWRMEGVLFRAVPLTLRTPLRTSSAVAVSANPLRNRVASAYFEDERQRIASLVNGASIKGSDAWCLGAQAETGDAVPLAVFSRSGGATRFLDAWTARRERIEPPPRRYWAWRLSMRPWNVFLAQVLQFQCQLRAILEGAAAGDGGPAPDACAPQRAAIGKAEELLARLESWHTSVASALTAARLAALRVEPFEVAAITGLKNDLGKLKAPSPAATDRVLLDGGVLELPAAGYLPVDVSGALTVNQQVRAFMGPGVDLRYCIVTPDYVPHALEMRQHMERISLLDGIEDPTQRPKVDILVPGGRIVQTPTAGGGIPLRMVGIAPALFREPVQGAANAAALGGGGTFALAGTSPAPNLEAIVATAKEFATASDAPAHPAPTGFTPITPEHLHFATTRAAELSRDIRELAGEAVRLTPLYDFSGAAAANPIAAVESSVAIHADPFALRVSDSTTVELDLLLGLQGRKGSLVHVTAGGKMFVSKTGSSQGVEYVVGTVSGSYAVSGAGTASPGKNVVWSYELFRRPTTAGATAVTGVFGADGLPWFMFVYTWSGSPLQGTLKVYKLKEWRRLAALGGAPSAFGALGGDALTAVPSQLDPLFEIQLTEDPAVADAAESHHVLAESALTILAAMLPNGADWQKAIEAALFPRPAGGADNITVLGERDWVLFARRRLDTCAEEVVTPTRPNRRYHVYVHEATGAEDAKKWVTLLLDEKGPELPKLRFVGRVELDGATDEPIDPAGLRTALEPVKGDVLRYDVVASDYGDGVSEEGRRRSRVEQCVSPVVDVTQAAPFELATLPARLRGRIDGGESVHGAIVLVTVQQIAVANVYLVPLALARRVLFDPQDDTKVLDPVDVTPFHDPASSLRLGSVTFRSGAPDDGELKIVAKKWADEAKSKGFELARLVTVTARAADDGAALREKDAILAAVGKGPATLERSTHASAGFDVEPSVNAMVLLVAGKAAAPSVTGTVVLVKAEGVREIKPLLDAGRVNEVLTSPRLKRFIEVVPEPDYHPETSAVVNPEPIREAWKRASGEARPGGLLTFVAGDDAGVKKEIRAQAKSVGAALTPGAAAPGVTVAAATDSPAIPAGAALGVYHFVLPK